MIPVLDQIEAVTTADAVVWLRAVEADVRAGRRERFATAFGVAGRKLGHAALGVGGWTAAQAGRARLLLAACEGAAPAERAGLVLDLFERGELSEQQAILRSLAALPDPEGYAPVAELAIRQNALPVLEAIACENAFPAAYLSAAMFDQMIMKCLFNGIALGRVEGLHARTTRELRRMVAAWVSERAVAGRPVPADVSLVLQENARAAV